MLDKEENFLYYKTATAFLFVARVRQIRLDLFISLIIEKSRVVPRLFSRANAANGLTVHKLCAILFAEDTMDSTDGSCRK